MAWVLGGAELVTSFAPSSFVGLLMILVKSEFCFYIGGGAKVDVSFSGSDFFASLVVATGLKSPPLLSPRFPKRPPPAYFGASNKLFSLFNSPPVAGSSIFFFSLSYIAVFGGA